ncbi:phosphoribosylanthranilate isomerase [Aestuariivivens marinum]|uniref:phosphoribosylanthranilate isomerase n=1 Tax=Aestuariivivens marinum TaxID=2913555 RepID=UPI001F56A30C|nr:phosphoribosylanthranilate isomerase [Aestuariivivens marinum]
MKLKICGMKYPDNIKQVTTLQPDYLGFIFYDKSARFFNDNIPEVSNTIKKVGVFVDAHLKEVINIVNKYNLQVVQLHGSESPEYCGKLRHNKIIISSGIEIIKVFSIKDEFNFEALKPYETVCDYYLFDTKGKLPGGNGYTFNWDVLNQYPSTKPFFLSGGIGIDQINDIKSFQQSKASYYCFALDVNSKFEIKPGLKDIELLKEFKQHLSC